MTNRSDYIMVRLDPKDRETLVREAERRGSYLSTLCRELIREGIRRLKRR